MVVSDECWDAAIRGEDFEKDHDTGEQDVDWMEELLEECDAKKSSDMEVK